MAFQDGSTASRSQIPPGTSTQGTSTGRGRTGGRCSDLRTYSTVSIPFLAGGETKLPNIFTAVLTGVENVLKAFRDWNKDPCIPDRPPVSLITVPAASSKPPSQKESKRLQTKLSYFQHKVPGKSQGSSTKNLVGVQAKPAESTNPVATVGEKVKDGLVEGASALAKTETGQTAIRAAENVTDGLSEYVTAAPSQGPAQAEDTLAGPSSPASEPQSPREEAEPTSKVTRVEKDGTLTIEDTIVRDLKEKLISPYSPTSTTLESQVVDAKREIKAPEKPEINSVFDKLEPVASSPSAPGRRDQDTESIADRNSIALQASPGMPKVEASTEPRTSKARESVAVETEQPPGIMRQRKSSGFSGHLDVQPSMITLHPVRTQVNIPAIRSRSAAVLSNVPPGIQGLKEVRASRMKTNKGYSNMRDEDKDFIDLFSEKGASRYVDALAKLESEFLDRLAQQFKADPRWLDAEWEEVQDRINSLKTIAEVEDEKELQDFDFPMVLSHDVGKFNVDVKRKLEAMNEVHNYGVKKVLHWIYKLQKNLPLDPKKILLVATQLLVELLIPSYGIFVRIAHYLADLALNPQAHHSNPPIGKLIHNVRNLVDTIADEIGAIGESSVQILIRIPNVDEDKIIDIVSRLYIQVQYADVALSRAVEILLPIMKLYYLVRRAKSARASLAQ